MKAKYLNFFTDFKILITKSKIYPFVLCVYYLTNQLNHTKTGIILTLQVNRREKKRIQFLQTVELQTYQIE